MDDTNVVLKSELDFVLGITENIDEIKSKFERSTYFMNDARRIQVMKKVPNYQQISGNSAFELLHEAIKSIYVSSTNADKVYADIRKAIEFKSPIQNETDKNIFNKSYMNWKRNPTNLTHVQCASVVKTSMKYDYDRWHESFTKEMKEIDEITEYIDLKTTGFNSYCDKLLDKTMVQKQAKEDIIANIILNAVEIQKIYPKLHPILKHILKILNDFNKKRITWAEFLIGMREWPSSSPKPVGKTPFVKQMAKMLRKK